MEAIVMLVLFLVSILTGVPIGVALGVAGVGGILLFDIVPISFAVQTMFNAQDSFPLLAIPFFTFAGEIMGKGGISKRLIAFAKSMLCFVKGSMGMITVFTCAIFAAISGSAPATVSAIGSLMIPEMEKEGYDKSYAATLCAVSGGLGPLIPPSIIMVIYGITAGESITSLFIAGLLPGILLAVLLMGANYIVCRKYGFEQLNRQKLNLLNVLKEAKNAFWALLMPIIILGGIYGGIFTATEAAIVASVYGIVVSIFVYKELKLKDLYQAFVGCSLTMGSVMIMMGCASLFGRLLSLLAVPTAITEAVTSMVDSKFLLLLVINGILLLAGMFMETLAAVMIFTPIMLPLVTAYGVSPIQFGAIICLNLVIGMVTPPVGCNLFIAQTISGVKLERMFRWLGILIAAMLIALAFTTYVPALSLILL